MNGPISKLSRCAIYTRKSTEHNLDLAFTSLDAQREACEAYIKSQAAEGWRLVPDHYDDGAFSGASLERPALQQLLADVRARKIDIVRGLQGRPADPLAGGFCQADRAVRRPWRLVRVGDAIVQHQLQHGAAHAQCAVVLCAVRARADRGAGARQDRGLQAQGPLGRRPGPARLCGRGQEDRGGPGRGRGGAHDL